MKKKFSEAKQLMRQAEKKVRKVKGPSLYEAEYLNQVVEELKTFLMSRNVTTVSDIYLGFQGNNYRGQMLLSKGA